MCEERSEREVAAVGANQANPSYRETGILPPGDGENCSRRPCLQLRMRKEARLRNVS